MCWGLADSVMSVAKALPWEVSLGLGGEGRCALRLARVLRSAPGGPLRSTSRTQNDAETGRSQALYSFP